MKLSHSIVSALLLITTSAVKADTNLENDGAFLDSKYTNIVKPVKSHSFLFANPVRSDLSKIVSMMTPIKSQGARGTCSIFASTAILEAMFVKNGSFDNTLDLSEEWLEYVIQRRQGSEGSTSYANFNAFQRYGSAKESLMPYIGETWKTLEGEGASNPSLVQERCGKAGSLLEHCLVAHRDAKLLDMTDDSLRNKANDLYDPEFVDARSDAMNLLATLIRGKYTTQNYSVYDTATVKKYLAAGTPLTLDIDFYYGAWNHRVAGELGIPRNMDHWNRGIIGYPAVGSLDREKSLEDPAGHSIVVVGYDDSMVVETNQLMTNGTTKKIINKGVYFFKNSWGAYSFGLEFKPTFDSANETEAMPGYGMITQDYAHEFGGFSRLPLTK